MCGVVGKIETALQGIGGIGGVGQACQAGTLQTGELFCIRRFLLQRFAWTSQVLKR